MVDRDELDHFHCDSKNITVKIQNDNFLLHVRDRK